MRSNMENNILYSPKIFGEKRGYTRFTMTGTFVIGPSGPTTLFLDAGISDRDVMLPPITPDAGQFYYIANTGSSGQLNVKSDGGVAILTIPPQRLGVLVSYISGVGQWFGVTTAAGASVVLAPVQRQVTASPITIALTDEIINCNVSAGAPVCTLPASATRAGELLTFNDIAGNFQAHPLTISASAGQTISGLSNIVCSTNFMSLRLRPLNDGVNSGWVIEQ